jgi:hypothetical protein
LTTTSPVFWLTEPMVATPVLLDVAEMVPVPFRVTVNLVLLVVMFSVSDAGLTVAVLSPFPMAQVAVLGPMEPSGHW